MYNPHDNNDFKNTTVMLLGGISESVNKFVFIAPTRCVITSIKLVSDTSTASSAAGSKEYTFQVANLTQTLDLLSATKKTSGTEITGDAAYDLRVNQNLTLAQDDVLELQIVKTGSPTDLSSAQISVALTYRPSSTYPV